MVRARVFVMTFDHFLVKFEFEGEISDKFKLLRGLEISIELRELPHAISLACRLQLQAAEVDDDIFVFFIRLFELSS